MQGISGEAVIGYRDQLITQRSTNQASPKGVNFVRLIQNKKQSIFHTNADSRSNQSLLSKIFSLNVSCKILVSIPGYIRFEIKTQPDEKRSI